MGQEVSANPVFTLNHRRRRRRIQQFAFHMYDIFFPDSIWTSFLQRCGRCPVRSRADFPYTALLQYDYRFVRALRVLGSRLQSPRVKTPCFCSLPAVTRIFAFTFFRLATPLPAAKKVLGFSSPTSNTVLRAELGVHPLETIRDARKLKWRYKVWNMPKKMLPALANSAVREKVTKGRAATRSDNVADEAWKEITGNEDIIKRNNRKKGKASVKKEVEGVEYLEIYGRLR